MSFFFWFFFLQVFFWKVFFFEGGGLINFLVFLSFLSTLDPALLKTARQSPTVVMATPPHEQQYATLLYLPAMLTQKGAPKVLRKAGNNVFKACRQMCLT